MRTFIQLKDGIGWASVNTPEEIEGAIEVEYGTGDFYVKKKYENGVWSEAPILKFAEIGDDGVILEIRRSYFPSDVSGPIITPEVTGESKWINGAWVHHTPPVNQVNTPEEL